MQIIKENHNESKYRVMESSHNGYIYKTVLDQDSKNIVEEGAKRS